MEERQIHHVDIEAPISDVWSEITKLRHIQKPMFNTILESDFKPGSHLLYRSEDSKRVFIIGEILELWTLEERSAVTRVTIVHSRFTDQKKTADSVRGSWVAILGNVKSVVETGDVPRGTRIKHGLMQAFMFMAPKSTLRENVAELKDER